LPLAQAELQWAERPDLGMGFVHPDERQRLVRVQVHMQAVHLKSSSNGLIVLTMAFILIVGQIMAGSSVRNGEVRA
jgi:hypothetical protein